LRLKLAKCALGTQEVEILGHKVSHRRVEPNDQHRECLRNFKEPGNASELLRFFGLLQFFSSHIDTLAEMAVPLYKVLEKTGWNRPKMKKEKIRIHDWDARWGGLRGSHGSFCPQWFFFDTGTQRTTRTMDCGDSNFRI
jgi:hypothetical protein